MNKLNRRAHGGARRLEKSKSSITKLPLHIPDSLQCARKNPDPSTSPAKRAATVGMTANRVQIAFLFIPVSTCPAGQVLGSTASLATSLLFFGIGPSRRLGIICFACVLFLAVCRSRGAVWRSLGLRAVAFGVLSRLSF